ncbi:hypothetical protein D5S18_24885 [Nocardia panacis]|uniref:Terminase n=1 Tax=Nocardia panacis TaxID=2340916 RepID=A0A3A4KCA9_9NOCA|nr:hypothetical protein [Nocardia panacis]RJO71410.1 hypothetical protein D5S18_24885 [Nocardia panacis]
MTDIWERAAKLPPSQRAAFATWARQNMIRAQVAHVYPSAGALAQALDPTTIQTPDLAMIDDALEWAFTTPAARLMISKPSQTGKSQRVVKWGVTRALQLNPDWRIIIATHSEDLARTHSEEIRTVLRTHGTGARDAVTGLPLPDRLGLGIGDKSAATRWQLAGHRGGVFACGVGTALPGRPADCMILDDLYADMLAADSPAERRRVNLWWDSVASQRPGPDAPIIFIGTRWNEQDAHAYLMGQEPGRWRVLNFPAIAEPGVPDALGREPGVPLENPRGRTDWEKIRATKPARVWSSMYQGSPTPADGALFNAQWFETYRLPSAPSLYRRIVGVDPAETGQGDEAGIIAAGLTGDGTVILTDDWSGQLSSAQWPRQACLLALHTGATELVFEAYSAAVAYNRLLKRAYDDLVAEADGGTVEGIAVPLSRPFHIAAWTRSGNALIRSTGLRHAVSNGRCRVLAHQLATMEAHAIRWFESQHQPDRVAAATIAYDVLAGGGEVSSSARPGGWGAMPDGITGR